MQSVKHRCINNTGNYKRAGRDQKEVLRLGRVGCFFCRMKTVKRRKSFNCFHPGVWVREFFLPKQENICGFTHKPCFKSCTASCGRSLTFCILCCCFFNGDLFSHTTSFNLFFTLSFLLLKHVDVNQECSIWWKLAKMILWWQYVPSVYVKFFLFEWFLWMQAAAGSCFLTSVTSRKWKIVLL